MWKSSAYELSLGTWITLIGCNSPFSYGRLSTLMLLIWLTNIGTISSLNDKYVLFMTRLRKPIQNLLKAHNLPQKKCMQKRFGEKLKKNKNSQNHKKNTKWIWQKVKKSLNGKEMEGQNLVIVDKACNSQFVTLIFPFFFCFHTFRTSLFHAVTSKPRWQGDRSCKMRVSKLSQTLNPQALLLKAMMVLEWKGWKTNITKMKNVGPKHKAIELQKHDHCKQKSSNRQCKGEKGWNFLSFFIPLTLDKNIKLHVPLANKSHWWWNCKPFEAWTSYSRERKNEMQQTIFIIVNIHNQLLQKCCKERDNENDQNLNPNF